MVFSRYHWEESNSIRTLYRVKLPSENDGKIKVFQKLTKIKHITKRPPLKNLGLWEEGNVNRNKLFKIRVNITKYYVSKHTNDNTFIYENTIK